MNQRVAAVGFGVLLGVVLAEGGARLVEVVRPGRVARAAEGVEAAFRPHPSLGWELRPGAVRKGGERVGRFGFRGDDGPYRRAGSAHRIACIGGSTTYSDGVGDEETYPVRLQEILSRRVGSRPIEVLNAGVPGYGSAESLMNLCLKVLDRDPDTIVVYHAVNDYRPRTVEGFDLGNRHFRRVWVDEELETSDVARFAGEFAIGRLLRRSADGERLGLYGWVERRDVRRLSRAQVVAANSLGAFERNLRAIVAVARGRGITPVLATQAFSHESVPPDKRGPFDEHNAVTREVARSTGALLVDVAAVLPQRGTFQHRDPVHMTPEGCRALARCIAGALVTAGTLERSAPAGPEQREFELGPLEAESALPPDAARALAEARAVRPCPYVWTEPVPGDAFPAPLGPHDARGFRGEGVRETRGAGRRVVVMGGASAYGLGVTEPESTARRLESMLRARGEDAEVIGAGVPGHGTVESVASLHLRVLPLDPDVVVIAHDVEDALALAAEGFRGDHAHHRKPFRAVEPGPLAVLAGARKGRSGVDPIGCGVPLRGVRPGSPPAAEGLVRPAGLWVMERDLRTMVDLSRASRARVVLLKASVGGASAGIRRAVEAWNEVVDGVGRATGADVVEAPLAAEHFLRGGWLPSARGHEVRAAALAAALAVGR